MVQSVLRLGEHSGQPLDSYIDTGEDGCISACGPNFGNDGHHHRLILTFFPSIAPPAQGIAHLQ